MSGIRKMNEATQDISGLALALLLDESFIELLGFCEEENNSVVEREPHRSFTLQKSALWAANEQVRLRRG